MEASLFALVSACIALSLALYQFVLSPCLFSSLADFPAANPIAAVSPIWRWWIVWSGQENRAIQKAHEDKGSIVRLSPKELSVNVVEHGVRAIYGGGYAKSAWYDRFSYYGYRNMFSFLDSHTHAQRKRLMSSDFSKSNIMASTALRDNAHEIIFARLLPAINASSAKTDLPINIHEMYKAAAIDFVTAFLFGLPSASRLLTDPHKRARIFHMYATKKSASWSEKLPFNFACLPAPLRSILMPREAIKANEEIKRFCLEMCSAADKAADANHSPADTSNVYQRMKAGLLVGKHMDSGLLGVSPLQQRSTFASEMLDHITAGHQTSAACLSFLTFELSRRPEALKKLQQELSTLEPTISLPRHSPTPNSLPSFQSLDALPYLDALVYETLRRYPPISGPQPRVVPERHATGGPLSRLPAGTRVSSQAYSLHRNAEIFPSPLEWRPERWTRQQDAGEDDRIRAMRRWFWAFGSGGRMCIGSHLAFLQIKLIVAAMFTNWNVEVVAEVGGGGMDSMEQADGYSGGLRSDRMDVRLIARGTETSGRCDAGFEV